MKLQFWLLDFNDEVVDGVSEVRLWGIDGDGRRVLVVDRSLQPYFYLLLEEGIDITSVIAEVNKQKFSSSIVTVEREADKKFFGKPVNAIKIWGTTADEFAKVTGVLTKINCVKTCLKDDLRLSSKYLVDQDVNPCGWRELDVEEIESKEDSLSRPGYLEDIGKAYDKI